MPMCPKSPICSRYKVFCQPFYMEYVEMKGGRHGGFRHVQAACISVNALASQLLRHVQVICLV
jgi:hypothetical protein